MRLRVLLTQIFQKKEFKYYFLKKNSDGSPHIFKKSNIDRYVERPSPKFCNGKYSALNDFCYAEFLAYYTLENKSSNFCEYQPDELDDSLIEKNHEESLYPKQMKLMISGRKMRCRKMRRILRFHAPNNILYPVEFAHHVLLLFYPFRDEKELLSGLQPLHQNKLKSKESRILNHMVIWLMRCILGLMRPELTIKTHIVKLKMMKFLEQNIPTTMIQKTQQQTKLLQFPQILPG